MSDLITRLKELQAKASPLPWAAWYVTTPPQTCPDGIDRPLIHAAAPPHGMGSDLERALGDDSIEKAHADSNFLTALVNSFPQLIARLATAEDLYLKASWSIPEMLCTCSDDDCARCELFIAVENWKKLRDGEGK